MSNRSAEVFDDPLITAADTGLPEEFFDRFVVNVHRQDLVVPSIIVGVGLHPARNTVDGFAIVSTTTEQRNVRFATELSAGGWTSCGPFSWEFVEPNASWQLTLADNPTAMSFDLVFALTRSRSYTYRPTV